MKALFPLVILFSLVAAPSFANDGQIPSDSLAKMGLGGLRTLSDTDGALVRGQSHVFTFSAARVGSTTRTQYRSGSNFAYSSRIVVGGGTIAGGGAYATAQ